MLRLFTFYWLPNASGEAVAFALISTAFGIALFTRFNDVGRWLGMDKDK